MNTAGTTQKLSAEAEAFLTGLAEGSGKTFTLEELEAAIKATKKKNRLYNKNKTETNQKVMTPPEFLMPARRVFTANQGFSVDWASSQDNVCDLWFGEDTNSLTLDWAEIMEGFEQPSWLNPPFAESEKFLKKCNHEARQGARIVALVQSAVGCSYWHKDKLIWGNSHCRIIFLEGRVPFVGYDGNGAKTDCVLIEWSPEFVNLLPHQRVLTWDWRKPDSLPFPSWMLT